MFCRFVMSVLLVMTFIAMPSIETALAQTDARPSPPQFAWTPQWSANRARPGYALLDGVEHFSIQLPSVEAGAYHHHPQISTFNGHFFASWSTHQSGEDGPGQYVRFSHSSDGQKWSPPEELFPSLDEMKVSTNTGRALTALRFIEANGKLFALAEVHQNTGFIRPDQLMTSPPESESRTDEFPKRSRRGLGRLIREVTSPRSLAAGKEFIFWLNDDKPHALDGFEDYAVATEANFPELSTIKRRLKSPLHSPTWDFKHDTTEIRATDGVLLLEPTTFQTPTGSFARLWRAQNDSFRMYGQTSHDGVDWSVPTITPIPDAPAKAVACAVDSSTVLLIGNQVFNKRGTRRDPITIAISKDGFGFDRAYSLRWRTPKFRTPRQQAEADGRGKGFQYPSVAIEDGNLWIIYSVNKEAIEVSRIRLQSMLNFSPCGFFDADCIAQVIELSEDRFKGVAFGQDAVLAGATVERFADQSCRLKMVWHLKKGRRPIRFIHICDAQGTVIGKGNLNRSLFESVRDDRTVLDSIRLSNDELRDASFIAVGFFDRQRKSSPITMPNRPKFYKLKLLDLSN